MSQQTARIETARLGRLDALERAARATLVVQTRDMVTAHTLTPGQSVVLGRGEEADARVEDASLSRAHARFTLGARGVEVQDLGSTNGTRVDGVPVDVRALAPGESALCGDVTVLVLGAHGVPWLVSHEALRARAEDERQRARLFARPFSVAVMRTPSGARALLDGLVALRSVDRAALFGERDLELVFPEAGAEDAQALVRALLAAQPSAQAAVASFPAHGDDADALFAAARAALGDAGQVALARATAPADAGDLVSQAPAMQAVMRQAERAAKAPVPLLLLGETGTGKEVLARFIHDVAARTGRTGPFVALNCGAIPLTLVESTLFGVVKGAFTGASADQEGAFESAHGGTVFLDEVGELPASAQAALLRVLENRTVTRVGSNKEVALDVRVVAATHRDLDAMVQAGAFRQDLLFRLNTLTLALPPLRERPEDIVPLAERFLAEAARAQRLAVRGLTDDARELLAAWPWPGNVRELKNAIERAVVFAGDLIDVDDLPPALRGTRARELAPPGARGTEAPAPLTEQVEAFERKLIRDALAACQGSVTTAAERLGLPKRTLQYKMKTLGLTRKVAYDG